MRCLQQVILILTCVQTLTIPSGGINDDYLYLTHGGTTAGTYDAGKYMIKLYGVDPTDF